MACAVVGGLSILPGPAEAQVGKDRAAAQIAEDYDVEVLRVRPGEIDGTPVWFVTVMQKGGTSNSAFRVTTLAVDQADGDLVPAFRHGANGAVGPATSTGIRSDIRPDALRSGIWR